MNSDTLNFLWILEYPIGIIEVSTSRKCCFWLYFISLHDYWPPSTWNSLVYPNGAKWKDVINVKLIFVVPCIMLNSEIIPTRCNNCVYSSQWLYSTCFGRQFHPLNTQHSEKQHGITRQCYLQLNTTDNDKTTRILTKITT